MSNFPKENSFNHIKTLDESIQWNPEKQFELRQKLEYNINKKNNRKVFKIRLLPIIGVVTAMCMMGILLIPYVLENDINEAGNASAPVEKIADAVLSVEELLNDDSVEYYVNLDINEGSECNFWLNNLHNSYNYKYKVYAPDGSLIGESITAGSQERLYSVDLNEYGSGEYKIKVYTPNGNIGGKYHLRVRNF
ncbi:hypothetical protein [Cytobacillus sp. IB215316]|uniref:hypothetical protein n=1 Tax=Cytobacillus sp. IB215316 TaxID=3097354 RepID=UPI002A0C6CC3|nr:hypothetical protein [Cytobacillus sp. IB215316]MDX8360357.1 hypothetical protein [Cytobacillus sp. IB215316]